MRLRPAGDTCTGSDPGDLAALDLTFAGIGPARWVALPLLISAKTASVHVTHMLRERDATSQVQAATLAECAGLLDADEASLA